MSVACDFNPLQDHSYLLSVVETIITSLREPSLASVHDLLDAYATFANRARSQSQLLDPCATLLPALVPLKVHKDTFVRALQRDVRLAHVDPLLTPSRPRSSLDASLLGSSMYLDVGVDAKQYARDSSSLCHHALCALSTIFRFPAFHFVFPEHDLSVLFGDVLDIALSEQLLVLNEVKTYSLSLWILSSHRLPATVLSSRRDDVFSALRRSLDGENQPGSIVLDGLKAISHTIEYHPSGFLDLLFPLLPCVMTSLLCDSSELRLHASIALGNFANALIHERELSLTKWQTLSSHITSYLESCCDESQAAPGNAGFSRVVRAAFSTEPRAYPRVAPTWMLSVLASLIVLCGPTLYRTPTVLRFIFQALAMALTHKRSIVRALHPHVWRCFVWTFGRMLSNSADVEPAFISSAFYLIKQEVGGGIGMALANVLLSDCMTATRPDERSDRVSRALSVVKAMVRTECKHTRQEGFMFLRAFTNVDQVRHQILQSMHEIPASVLFNGAIAGAKWDNLPPIIYSISNAPFSVRWLEVAEVAQHHKTLLLIWKCFITKADRKDLNPSLIDVWLSILLACSHQLEHGQHSTMTTDVPRYAATIIIEFLPPLAFEDRQPDWGSWNVHDQRCSLMFIDQLWSAVRKAFVTLNLAEAAGLILTSILKYAFHILDVGVRTLWSRLCANLLIIASPSCLCDIHEQSASGSVIRSRRELWAVVAISLSPPELGLDWKELVNFLSIPICTWVLSKPELGAWKALLRSTITLAGDSTMVVEHLILQHLHRKEVEAWESIVAVLGFLLICTNEQGNFPTDNLLSMADSCLIASYSRAGRSPEALAHSLELLNVIRHIIVSAPGKVMHILQALCGSLCLWIEDHSEVMSNDEFNSVAVSLYCETLEVLKILPPSVQSLRDMENFLASAFSRIPTPAIAPFAFEKFWRATYHGHSQFYCILPPKIKSCLACFVAAYGGDLAHGLALSSESQAQSGTDGSLASFSANTHGFCLERNGFQVNIPINAGTSEEVSSRKVVQYGQRQTSAGQEDTTFLVCTSDGAPQVTALRQLREYSSRIDTSPPGETERSTSKSQILIPPGDATPDAYFAKKNPPVTSYVLHQERRDDAPSKRSRISRDVLRSVRGSESEPATREVTPMNVLRMRSVPLKKKVFDGVEVPSLRGVSRQKNAARAETSDTLSIEQGPTSIPQTPSLHSAYGERASPTTLSPFAESAVENFDWENFRVDSTSSEIDVDRSLMDFNPSSPPRVRNFTLHERDDKSYSPSRSSSRKAVSQGEGSPSGPTRPSLRRAKTTSTTLDALRDIYASVVNGASQIPMSELVQATRLVHQISAALTEQIGKKMGDSG